MSTGKEIARLKRRLKRGPRLTRKGRCEYLRWLLKQSDGGHAHAVGGNGDEKMQGGK